MKNAKQIMESTPASKLADFIKVALASEQQLQVKGGFGLANDDNGQP